MERALTISAMMEYRGQARTGWEFTHEQRKARRKDCQEEKHTGPNRILDCRNRPARCVLQSLLRTPKPLKQLSELRNARPKATMFERYTEDARKVIFLARYEASRLGSPILETEHLWLGLLRQSKKAVKRLAPHITIEAVHERLTGPGLNAQRTSMATDMPLSGDAKRVLAGATAEADSRSQQYITDEYLILALLHEESPNG
jgi:hypothetical protein